MSSSGVCSRFIEFYMIPSVTRSFQFPSTHRRKFSSSAFRTPLIHPEVTSQIPTKICPTDETSERSNCQS